MPNLKIEMKKLHTLILESQKILILTHDSPDLDAMSSIFSLSHIFDHFHKPYTILFKQKPPKYLVSLDAQKTYEIDEQILTQPLFGAV